MTSSLGNTSTAVILYDYLGQLPGLASKSLVIGELVDLKVLHKDKYGQYLPTPDYSHFFVDPDDIYLMLNEDGVQLIAHLYLNQRLPMDDNWIAQKLSAYDDPSNYLKETIAIELLSKRIEQLQGQSRQRLRPSMLGGCKCSTC
ncbi:hypothetical protein [Vibrio sinaloensis]|uniref:hypothetical protein n=1 Tax=Photobacterium sp. (strain ATCC 43367) TaxID=379097 RepID=UPI002059D727|nr:hypothetical protein [Vibrio sinaloensis]UPQ87359.1 hypothetical protein MTO69_10040 [Vibrio sinaloensis]